ncbi:MAG TPA: helix-turn-helix transcriptional regulator [Candidatus Paceibacterota bacterium]|nr:helix-turn-helix transcriptional regulator [Candidatus Paceibacterota bacterium]
MRNDLLEDIGQIMSSQSKSNAPVSAAFGEWLRELREKKGGLLREVAAAAKMDVAHLSKIELGQRLPTEEQTLKLASFFGVPANEMQARWIAERFRASYGDYPAAQEAIEILAEEVGIYRAKRSR